MIFFLRSSLSHEQRSGNIRATIAGTLIGWGDIEYRGWKRREGGVRLIKQFFFLLNEFIYANEGKPREIAQVVDVTQIIMKHYIYISIMSDYIMYGKSSMIF